MVRPGVTTRNPRLKCLLPGRRTALIGLPGDEHGHDGGLARAGGQLQREAHQFRIGVSVGVGQVVEQALSRLRLRRDLGQPDGRLGRLHLAEERAHAAEIVMAPVLKQAGRLRRHLPWTLRQRPPLVHVLAHFVDDRGGIVLLLLRGKPLAFVEHDVLLCGHGSAFLRLRNRRNELRPATVFENLLCRLAALIKFPVPPRRLIGRVEDGVIEERIGHGRFSVCKASGDDKLVALPRRQARRGLLGLTGA